MRVLVLKVVLSGFAALVLAVCIVTVTESTPGFSSVALADTPTDSPTPTDTPTLTDTPTPTPTDTPTPTPTYTPTPSPTPTQNQLPVAVGLDMNTTATSPAVYNGSSLPKFEPCIDVKTNVNNGVFYIDVFALRVTNLIGFIADVSFTPGKMQIQQADVNKFLGNSSTISNYSTNSLNGTSTINPPVSNGIFEAYGVDIAGAGTHTGSGVLVRLQAQAFNTGPNVVSFNISTAPSRGVTLTADPNVYHPGDTTGDGIFDGTPINATAKIAVDQYTLPGWDTDSDGVSNACDNCPNNANGAAQANTVGVGNQTDTDRDGLGDACDSDADGDTIANGSDNCPYFYNPGQGANDCVDTDGDGIPNSGDNCPTIKNSDQSNFDGDTWGDACDDSDGDGSTDQLELFVGTLPNQRCPSTATRNDELVDSTPFDNDDNRLVNGSDFIVYAPNYGSVGPNPPYKIRFDTNMDNRINGSDFIKFAPFYGKPPCVYP